MPVPLGREPYGDAQNLCIEFYFNDEVLAKRTEAGYGLNFYYPPITVEGVKINSEILIPETRKIKGDGGKKFFAESIVPTLQRNEFDNFRELFEKIIALYNTIQDNNESD